MVVEDTVRGYRGDEKMTEFLTFIVGYILGSVVGWFITWMYYEYKYFPIFGYMKATLGKTENCGDKKE